jgi:small GTP-binding protein
MAENEDFFGKLEERTGTPIPPEQKEAIKARLRTILTYEPKIGFFGKTGVGKSSLCNALFGKDVCPVSDVESCTRDPQEVLLNMGGKGIKLVDVPGVGESEARNAEYAKLYNSLLPKLDLVLWVIKGDDRAFSTDAEFYENIVKPHVNEGKLPFFFVVNQADKIEPFREWDVSAHKPGVNQFANIDKKIESVARAFKYPKKQVIAVSANEKYGLVELVDTIAYELPKEKRIGFAREVPQKLRTPEFKSQIKESLAESFAMSVFEATGNQGLASAALVLVGIPELVLKYPFRLGKSILSGLKSLFTL